MLLWAQEDPQLTVKIDKSVVTTLSLYPTNFA